MHESEASEAMKWEEIPPFSTVDLMRLHTMKWLGEFLEEDPSNKAHRLVQNIHTFRVKILIAK